MKTNSMNGTENSLLLTANLTPTHCNSHSYSLQIMVYVCPKPLIGVSMAAPHYGMESLAIVVAHSTAEIETGISTTVATVLLALKRSDLAISD